jgi:hypothetical protein
MRGEERGVHVGPDSVGEEGRLMVKAEGGGFVVGRVDADI